MSFGFGALPAQSMRLEDLARLFDPALFGMPQGFSGTSGEVAPQAQPDVSQLFNRAPMGGPQSFAGTSGQVVEPEPLRVPVRSPQSMFEQPARPPTAPASMPPPPPQAGGPVAADFVPPPMPPQAQPQSAPAPQPAPGPRPAPETTGSFRGAPASGGGFLDALSRPSVYNTLLGIGTGLMSTPGLGQGFAAGIGNASQLNRQQSISDLANAELALKAHKLRQEEMALGGNAALIKRAYPTLSEQEARSAAGNGTLVTEALKRVSDPNAGRQIGEDAEGVKRWVDTGQPVFAGDKAKRDVQLVARTDGSVVAVDKNALASGEGGGPGGTVLPPLENKEAADIRARERELIARGIDPKDPRYQDYMLTGTMPKDNQQALTAPDKKAIHQAEDAILPLESTIDRLKRAKALNPQAFEGATAGVRSMAGSNLPDGLVPDWLADPKGAMASREFNQLMSQEAIQSMADTLAGATTDREMASFVEILGSPTTPRDIRERTINRMLQLAERKKELAASRIGELRGGTYYKPRDADGIGAALPRPQSEADFAKLRSGEEFIAPDGTRRVKP